jgi:hypothetical protein
MTAYEDMRASYDWRSAIVHGNTSREANLEKALPLASVVSITGTKLREAILKILELKEPFEAATIEKNLLRDSAPQASEDSSGGREDPLRNPISEAQTGRSEPGPD